MLMNRDTPGIWAMKRDSVGCLPRNRETGAAATWRNLLGICVATNREPITFPTWAVVDRPLGFHCVPVLFAAPRSPRGCAWLRDGRGYTVPIPRLVSVPGPAVAEPAALSGFRFRAGGSAPSARDSLCAPVPAGA